MKAYAEISDITAIKSLTAQQQEAAEILIPQACSILRTIARKYGREIDDLIADEVTGEDFALSVKSIVIQAVCRALDSLCDSLPKMTQGTESIGSYSLTATYLNAGQSLYFLNNELKLLGLKRQTYGALNLYAEE